MDMENTIKNLSDAELLRIINPSLPVMIGEYSVSELLDVAEEEALSIKGIGEAKVKVLIALKEIIHRIMHRAMGSIESIQSPADAIEYFQHLASRQKRLGYCSWTTITMLSEARWLLVEQIVDAW